MTTTHTDVQASETAAPRYADPVVNGFYGKVIQLLEDAPDGASAAAAVTGEFHRHHNGWTQQNTALMTDIRRISADESAKAAMLTHAARHSGRMVEENTRLVGQLHAHESAEARLGELAERLEETSPAVAEQLRDILAGLARPVPPAVGTVIVASALDPRWSCGWFRQEGHGPAPLVPLPFAGWVLVADDPHQPTQHVQAAFLMAGTWYSKGELLERGYTLERID